MVSTCGGFVASGVDSSQTISSGTGYSAGGSFTIAGTASSRKSVSSSAQYSSLGFNGSIVLQEEEGKFKNGIIVYDYPEIKDGQLVADKSSLIEKLLEGDELLSHGHPIFTSKDNLVRFVPFEFEKEPSYSELQKHPYVLAVCGKEGSEKLSWIASKYQRNPTIYIENNENFIGDPTIGISSFDYSYEKRLAIHCVNQHLSNSSFGIKE